MTDDIASFLGEFEKQREAEIIIPPNTLQEKVGMGGIDPVMLQRAEDFLKSNNQDFQPIADTYFDLLDKSIQRILKEEIIGDEAFEALLYPLVQLKAHGTMFKYPIVTEISGMLINFLEVIKSLDKDAADVILAHKMTLQAVLSRQIKTDKDEEGRALTEALKNACMRYFQTYGQS